MVKTVILFVGVCLILAYAIYTTDQLRMFTDDWFAPFFVLFGGISMALSVNQRADNLFLSRLEAFRNGCTLFGVIGTLIGFIAVSASLEVLGAISPPAIGWSLMPLLWVAVFNYFAKLIIISKANGG